MWKSVLCLSVFLAFLAFVPTFAQETPPTTAPSDRTTALEAQLAQALTRIEGLEKRVAALETAQTNQAPPAPQQRGKPAAVDPVPLGSKWHGKTFGTLGNNQPIPNNGGPIDGQVLTRLDDAFTLRIEVRANLVFTIDCKLINGNWQIDRMVANPAGAGQPGPIPLPKSSIKVLKEQIEIYVESPTLKGPGLNKITYQLARVN